MKTLIQKLSSRKLWMAIGTSLIVLFKLDASPEVIAAVEAFIAAAYMLSEAIIDAERAKKG